jgi:Ca2+-binding EF-hand superfamily protein
MAELGPSSPLMDFTEISNVTNLTNLFKQRAVDGFLTKDAFIQTLHDLGIGDASAPETVELLELTILFETFDRKHTHSVDIAEFTSGMQILFKGNGPDMLDFAFAGLHCDEDGTVSIQEFLAYFKHYFEAKCAIEQRELEPERWACVADHLQRVFNASDKHHVGRLKVEDFKAAVSKDPDHPFTLIWDSFTHVRQRSTRRSSSASNCPTSPSHAGSFAGPNHSGSFAKPV